MNYSIGEVAEKMHISIHTLRYYDQEGLLPFIERSSNGRRVFHERDIILLNTIGCLKGTGMSLKEIKQYVIWCVEGFSSVPKRYDMMQQRKQDVENQIKVLNKTLETIENKCKFYEKAIVTGNTDMSCSERESWAEKILNEF